MIELAQKEHQGHASATTRGANAAAAIRRECVEYFFTIFECYKVSSETICASIKVLDKFLLRACEINSCDRGLGHAQFQGIAGLCARPMLLSVSCFLIVCKFREVMCPQLGDLEALSGGRCKAEDICASEIAILTALDWDLHVVTAIDICNKIMGAAPPDTRACIEKEVHLVAEVASYEHGTLGTSAASIAVCSILVAAERLKIPRSIIEGFLPSWVVSQADLKACAHLESFFGKFDLDASPILCAAPTEEAPPPAKAGGRRGFTELEIETSDISDALAARIDCPSPTPSPSNACSIPSAWASSWL